MSWRRDVVTAPRDLPCRGGRIELRLRRLEQLFDSFDPAPFHEKDLDGDAEEFIVSWAREYPVGTPLVFRLHLPEDQRQPDAERVVTGAVHNYFAYRADLARLELRRTLQLGRTAMLVGIAFLAVCMAARELVRGAGDGDWLHVVQEGLLIIGWVAMWRPIELLLYDWWPLRRMRRTYSNLAKMKVEVAYGEAPRSVPSPEATARGECGGVGDGGLRGAGKGRRGEGCDDLGGRSGTSGRRGTGLAGNAR
jgi:hypothetical protein